MTLSKNKIILLGGAVVAVVIIFIVIFVFFGSSKPSAPLNLERAGVLTLWGVFDDQKKMKDLLDNYVQTAGIQVKYIGFSDPLTYEKELINALAAGRGPDIFMFHNTWLPKHRDKIVPLAAGSLPFDNFQQLFPRVVEQDFSLNGVIYALPASLDTMALFYNKDIFDQTAIVDPPETWNEFQDAVVKARIIDLATKKIIRAGAAMGGSGKSINRVQDIISLLMLQKNIPMVNSNLSGADFMGKNKEGEKILNFYTQFANPISPFYTWHDDFMDSSIEAFNQLKATMMFNYAYQIPILREKNPFLNFGVASVPQLTPSPDTPVPSQVSIANYWGFAVANQTRFPLTGWKFILSLTTNPDAARQYLKTFNKPPALKALIKEYINDPQLGVFARQALTARSWPQADNVKIEEIFSNMIQNVLKGQFSAKDALDRAEKQVTFLMVGRDF